MTNIFIKRLLSTCSALQRKIGIYEYAMTLPKIRQDDVWLVSYPKSGNTYLRFLVACALRNQAIDFYDVDKIVPDIYQVKRRQLEKMPSPRVLKSHEMFRKDYRKVLYVVRNPKDVVTSFAYWSNRDKPDEWVADNIDRIVVNWLNRVDRFWNWKDHVEGWSRAGEPNSDQLFKLIKYEDMIRNPISALAEFEDICGLKLNDAVKAEAVANASKDKMRAAEIFAKPYFTKEIRPFVRTGSRLRFDELVSHRVKDLFYEELAETMAQFNYPTD